MLFLKEKSNYEQNMRNMFKSLNLLLFWKESLRDTIGGLCYILV